MRIQSFPPIADANATLLILGTIPGKASLKENQYYAHPQNLFWKILGNILEFDPLASYEKRVKIVLAARIAIWDVTKSCARESSLDADISAVVPNDFNSFFSLHPQIRRICFNGAKAEQLFMKHVYPPLAERCKPLEFIRLPSTSPANASIPFDKKLEAWETALSNRVSVVGPYLTTITSSTMNHEPFNFERQ